MDFRQLLEQARRGVHQTPVLPGRRSPKGMVGWRERATTSAEKLKALYKEYPNHNWCSVARKGLVCIIDIDDLAFAKESGMPIPRTLTVKSPSGGYHLYLYATDKSDKLGNCDVLGPDGKPAVEFKSHNKTVAAPGTWRDDKEPFGWYRIVRDTDLVLIPDELVGWIWEHGSKKNHKDGKFPKAQWHPTFDRYDWLEHHELALTGHEKTVAGVLYVELQECPFVGRAHTGAGEGSFCTCVTFGTRIGFSCLGCPDKHIEELREHFEEEGIEEYEYCVYLHEDPSLAAKRTPIFAFDVEEAR